MSGSGEKASSTSNQARATEGTGPKVEGPEGSDTKTSKPTNSKPDDKDLLYFAAEKITNEDLTRKKRIKVEVNGESIALISHANNVYAIQEKCPHYGGPLHQGDIEDVPPEGPCIRCPWHSWKFSLTTGKCVSPQRDDKCLKIYPVKITKGTNEIKIGFETIAENIFNSTPP